MLGGLPLLKVDKDISKQSVEFRAVSDELRVASFEFLVVRLGLQKNMLNSSIPTFKIVNCVSMSTH